MRVVLITQGVSRLVDPLLNSKHQVVGVVESMPRDFHDRKSNGLLFGLLSFLYKVFRGRAVDLQSLCQAKDIPYNFICNGRDVEVAQWIKDLQPDLVVVFSMSQLLKADIINIPKYGVINMHPSWLPEYRGANPDFWQYYNMDLNPGVTVHYVDPGEDTGDIVFQERISIALGEKSPVVLDKLIGGVGVSLVLKALDAIERGDAPRIKQPEISPTGRARNLSMDEHATIVDWQHWPIERVWHVLRGTELWLNAISPPKGLYTGQRWIVDEFVKTENSEQFGTLVKFRGRHCVATKDGFIFLSRRFSIKKMIIGVLQK